jgi:hypothetical protein
MSVALARKDTADPRGALRLAIENKAAIEADLAKRQSALEAALKHATAAQTKLAAATAAVGEARSAHVERVARALSDGRAPPMVTLQDKRDTVDAARDEHDAVRAAIERLQSEVAHLESDVVSAENDIIVAANTLLAGVLARKLEDARRKQIELLVLKSALYGLIAKDESPPAFADQMMDFRAARQRDEAMPLRDAVKSFLNVDYPNFPDEVRAKVGAEQRAWREARIALRSDPDFGLPE